MLSFECIKNEKSVYFLLTSAIWRKFMNFGQISGHLPGFAHFQKPGFDQ